MSTVETRGIASSAELRALIAHYGKTDPDPGVVTEKILANLTDVEAHIVAAVTLRDYVRHVLVRPSVASAPPKTYETRKGQKTASAATAVLSGSRNVWLGLIVTLSVLAGLRLERRFAVGAGAGAALLLLVSVALEIGPMPERVRKLLDVAQVAKDLGRRPAFRLGPP